MKSESLIQNEIRLALSRHGIVLRLNSGKAWNGKRMWDNNIQQYVLTELRAIALCPTGTPDLLFLGEDGTVAFIECKTLKGKAKEAQERFIKIMHLYGIKAGIARSAEDALAIIGLK